MKRKLVMLLTIVAVLAVGIGIWYNVPINLMDLEHDEVIEIVVFNGNTGNATHITDETQIEHIIENLNEIKLKRSKPSVGYSGYSFKMTIYLSDGNEADDWNNLSSIPMILFGKTLSFTRWFQKKLIMII